jgi:D-lactate dehydrogenase
MREIKAIFDPHGLLNPGVLINDDHDAHLKNLKPLPECDSLVDKCIECGFCEPKCPSHKLTLSPRQRIVGWREIRDSSTTAPLPRNSTRCARSTTSTASTPARRAGLCATACPVGIETGL